jgi:hypothetical protein
MKHFKPVHDPAHLTALHKTAHKKDTDSWSTLILSKPFNQPNYSILNTQPLRLQTEPHF